MTSRSDWEEAVDDLARHTDLELENFDHGTDEDGSRCYAVYSYGRDLLTFFAFSNGSVALETSWLSPVSGLYREGPVLTIDDPVDTPTGWNALLLRYRRMMSF